VGKGQIATNRPARSPHKPHRNLTQVNVSKARLGNDEQFDQSTEMVMTEQSSMHLYLNWTKERIDEMDAALASLEVKASQAKADSKEKADEIIADLKKRRDEFQALLKTQAESGEAAWARAKTDWTSSGTASKPRCRPISKAPASRSSSSRPRSRTSLPRKQKPGARRRINSS
jgi:hypothetical protein